ncbi:MAG: large subunit ribosomal protein [Fusobacteriaceae bacterium]|jgi:large subunit ribosomal protein L28|nr:rpmB [Fusobacteriales bacterium]MDN5304857.1 large subunit ribosomal protein [Fusobacteriaceae bacterium]
MRVCEVTGKGTVTGNQISHSHRVTKRIWKPNLQTTKLTINGVTLKVRVSTKVLKTLKTLNDAETVKYLRQNKKTLSPRLAELVK